MASKNFVENSVHLGSARKSSVNCSIKDIVVKASDRAALMLLWKHKTNDRRRMIFMKFEKKSDLSFSQSGCVSG